MKSPSARFVRRFLPLLALVMFGGLLLTRWPASESPLEAEAEAREAKPGADEWFYEQRAYPLNDIPPVARVRAIEQLEALEARQQLRRQQLYGKQAADVIADSLPRWEAVGPRPIGPVARANSGRASALALDPRYDGVNNQTVYLGTAQGGVWRSPDNGANWTPIFDEQPTLAIGSIAIDPLNPAVIYAGTGEGNQSADSYYGQGLFKSVDGGASWRQITGPLSTIAPRVPAFQGVAIMDIAIDPRNTQTIYLCTRNASAASAQNAGSVTGYGAGERGVWKSGDGGLTWRNLNPANLPATTAYTASDLLIHPQFSNMVFVGIPGRGLYRSTEAGEPGTWQLLGNGLPETGASVSRMAFAVGPPLAPATQPTIFVIIADPNPFATNRLVGIYRTSDNGQTWTKTAGQPNDIQANYNLTISVDPRDANILYVGMVNFFRSLDGGATWQTQIALGGGGSIHVDHHASLTTAARPNVLFAASDGGAWRADNAGGTAALSWTTLNPTLNTVQFQSVGVHPTNPDFLIGGTQDNGTLRFTGDPAWLSIFGGDGGYALIDQSNPNILWQSTQSSAGTPPSFGPRVSINGGTNFTDRGCRTNCQAVPGSMNPGDRVRFYSVMELNTGYTQPNNVIYWGTQRVYRSANLGQQWTGLGPSADGFGQDFSNGAGTVTVIAPHPKLDTATDPPGETLWVATSDANIHVTTQAGKLADAVFTRVNKAPLPNRVPVDIALDPNDTRRAYVVYSGFNLATPALPGHVFVTEDLGATWRDLSGDLPDVPVTSIALDPKQPGTLFIGTDIGVFQTTDEGASWVRLGNGMPRVATFMLRFQAATRTLVAATHGRGMFRLKLAAPVVTVSAASLQRGMLAVDGIAAAFGTGLATRTEAAQSLPLPTQLAGTTVRLTDANGVERLAPLFFVSPQQVNYQIPPEVLPGAVTVTIASGDTSISFGIENVREVAPSLFTANGNGRGVPAGYGVRGRAGVLTSFPIAVQVPTATPPLQPAEIDLGPEGDQVVLVLFGTGLRRRSALSAVRVSIGGVEVTPDFAGAVTGLVGLDQLNFAVPRSLIGKGDVDVTVAAHGAVANTGRVRIK